MGLKLLGALPIVNCNVQQSHISTQHLRVQPNSNLLAIDDSKRSWLNAVQSTEVSTYNDENSRPYEVKPAPYKEEGGAVGRIKIPSRSIEPAKLSKLFT